MRKAMLMVMVMLLACSKDEGAQAGSAPASTPAPVTPAPPPPPPPPPPPSPPAAVASEGSDDPGDPIRGAFTIEQATEGLKGKGTLEAIIDTTLGTFTCELAEKDAPNTVANFVGLARGIRPWKDPKTGEWVKRPFYDGLTFHRVIPGFMIQGGDPMGVGVGGPGYTIAEEFSPKLRHDKPGTLSMAKKPIPHTTSSQFFITDVPTPFLDDKHSVFGHCTPEALVHTIAKVPRGPNDRPNEPVVMKKVTIKRK